MRIMLAILLVLLMGSCAKHPRTFMPPGKVTFTVACCGSMEPAYQTGDIAVIIPGRYQDIKAGDVVIRGNCDWTKFGNRVAHRAIRKTWLGWVTKGDPDPKDDPGLMREPDFGGFVHNLSR